MDVAKRVAPGSVPWKTTRLRHCRYTNQCLWLLFLWLILHFAAWNALGILSSYYLPIDTCSIPVLTTGQRQRDVPGLSHILERPWLPKHSHRIRLTLHSKLRISILQERGRQQEHVLSCVSWKPSNLPQTGQWELHSFPIFVLVCFKARFPWGAHALLSPLEWAGPWFHFSCRPGCLSL